MLFWLADRLEALSEEIRDQAWHLRWALTPKRPVDPRLQVIIETTLRARAPEVFASVTQSNALLKKLQEKR